MVDKTWKTWEKQKISIQKLGASLIALKFLISEVVKRVAKQINICSVHTDRAAPSIWLSLLKTTNLRSVFYTQTTDDEL
jgi:hypothetical protein